MRAAQRARLWGARSPFELQNEAVARSREVALPAAGRPRLAQRGDLEGLEIHRPLSAHPSTTVEIKHSNDPPCWLHAADARWCCRGLRRHVLSNAKECG